MSDMNTQFNRAVWFDIPVSDLDRAIAFYSAVLNIRIDKIAGETPFAVLEHHNGNGGCLVVAPSEVSASKGALLYLNVNARLHEALACASKLGGSVVQDIHSFGGNGHRALVLDSEGNRIALHSMD